MAGRTFEGGTCPDCGHAQTPASALAGTAVTDPKMNTTPWRTPMKKTVIAIALTALVLTVAACESAADKANSNLSKAAENFEVPRRIVGINGITDEPLFEVTGFCSYEVPDDGTFEAICKNEDGSIERTTLYLSDNVTFVSTQLRGVDVDLFNPRIIFRPETIIPDFDLSTSGDL